MKSNLPSVFSSKNCIMSEGINILPEYLEKVEGHEKRHVVINNFTLFTHNDEKNFPLPPGHNMLSYIVFD